MPFFNEHGCSRRYTDAVLFCTNFTNLTNGFMYGTLGRLSEHSFSTDDSFYTDFINEHGTARRNTYAGLFCTNLTNLTNGFMYGTHGTDGNSFYTDDSFYTDFINEHGKARRFTEFFLDGNSFLTNTDKHGIFFRDIPCRMVSPALCGGRGRPCGVVVFNFQLFNLPHLLHLLNLRHLSEIPLTSSVGICHGVANRDVIGRRKNLYKSILICSICG